MYSWYTMKIPTYYNRNSLQLKQLESISSWSLQRHADGKLQFLLLLIWQLLIVGTSLNPLYMKGVDSWTCLSNWPLFTRKHCINVRDMLTDAGMKLSSNKWELFFWVLWFLLHLINFQPQMGMCFIFEASVSPFFFFFCQCTALVSTNTKICVSDFIKVSKP